MGPFESPRNVKYFIFSDSACESSLKHMLDPHVVLSTIAPEVYEKNYFILNNVADLACIAA